MYTDQDPEKVMDVLHARGLMASVDVGLVTGTGLTNIAKEIENPLEVPYEELPGFPSASVSGHAGRLVIGNIGRRRVAVLQGRSHYYETGDPGTMRTPIEVLLRLGAHSVVLTSSVGAIRPGLRPGALAIVTDHINLSGVNPLVSEPGDSRFVSMTDAYDASLRHRLKRAAASQGGLLNDAIYMFMPGPSFETPAEIRMARIIGADLVGMSTAPEVILARRLGLKVAAVAMATNFGAGMDERETISHAQTKAVALQGAAKMKALIRGFLTEFQP